ncbi:MAG: class I SAM-dependent methyltransferase [Winogradskyella sp.]
MKKIIKDILPKWSVDIIKTRRRRNIFKNKSISETFTYINESGYWKSKESVSGDGSELLVTQELSRKLEQLILDKDINSMLDIPCGDFNWMQKVHLKNTYYTGADIVENIIATNQQKYNSDRINFKVLDITKDTLPKVDLIFCRDCLVHFSFKDIYKALVNIKNSKSKYLLTTAFYRCDENKDIVTGEWRKINFELPPFNFKKPIEIIDENYTVKGYKYSDKSMCLWEVNDIVIPFRLKLFYWFT